MPVTRPYDPRPLLTYLRVRAVAGMEIIDGESYARVVRLAGKPRLMTTDLSRARDGSVVARCVPGDEVTVDQLRRLTAELVDAAAPIRSIERRLIQDSQLASLVRRNSGSRIPGTVDPFELAVRAVLGQQVSVAMATVLAARVADGWGDRLADCSSPLSFAFPQPEQLVDARLEKVGLSGGRAEAIRALSRGMAEGSIELRHGTELERTERALLAIRGIGPWTAAYVALRGLGDADALPSTDLGLRQALGGLGGPCSAIELSRRADAWRPWRGYGAVHLWNTFLGL